MRPEAAVIEFAVQRAARAVESAIANLSVAEANVRERRLELGRALIEARALFPKTGRNAGGWSRFVIERKLNLDVALDAMKYAGYVEANCQPGDPLPTRAQAGIDKPAEKGSAAAGVLPVPQLSLGPSAEVEPEIDRDTWCTPPWLTEAIGHWDLDPCSNDRATVPARMQLRLDLGQDGLVGADVVDPGQRVFINPPYSDVGPWIAAYKHTRFCFLLKLDTSTKWFAELHAATALILIPRRRVNFIPPPGVPADKAVAQQFPHALFYAHAEDATDAIRALCWSWRVEQPAAQPEVRPHDLKGGDASLDRPA